jgi:hypothetical protein
MAQPQLAATLELSEVGQCTCNEQSDLAMALPPIMAMNRLLDAYYGVPLTSGKVAAWTSARGFPATADNNSYGRH